MKLFIALFLTVLTCLHAQESDKRFVVVPITDLLKDPRKEAPLFFSATADVNAQVGLETVTSEQRIHFKIHQGKAETLTISLGGAGDVVAVTGEGLGDWAVRVAGDGSRFLDVRPLLPKDAPLTTLEIQVKTLLKIAQGNASLLLPGPASAAGFSLSVTATTDPGVDLRILKADGLVPVGEGKPRQFLGYGAASLEFAAFPIGYILPDLELLDSSLSGRLAADGNSISFLLRTTARATKEKATAKLVSGVALSAVVSGDGWHVVLRDKDGGYDLVAERAGDLPVELEFVAPVRRNGDWRVLEFTLPAGVVVPVRIEGLAESVSFDRSLAVVPERDGAAWRGFLPANGRAGLAWRSADVVADGALFFSSTESSDVRS
jgi:hypothetical protein